MVLAIIHYNSTRENVKIKQLANIYLSPAVENDPYKIYFFSSFSLELMSSCNGVIL